MEDQVLLVFPAAYSQFHPLRLQRNELLPDLEVGPLIGAGSYGKVFRGTFFENIAISYEAGVIN